MYCVSETYHSTCMLLLFCRFWLLRLSSFVSRFGLKRLLNVNVNHIGFTSRKHAPVLGFFQSHDHTVYSKRGTLWTDLVWKSELLHKCEILEDLHQRLVPEKGDERSDLFSIYVITWNNVALVWHLFKNDVSFYCPLLPFPQPHWGVFMSLEMEGFWPSSTGPNVPPGCNGCWIPRHHSWTLPGVDKTYQQILPKMPCQRRYQVWCGWEHVAKQKNYK